MTTLLYREPELVIAFNNLIIFVNPNDLQIFKEIYLPKDLGKYALKSSSDQGSEDHESSNNKSADECEPTVQHLQLSPNGLLMAVTTAGQKAVLLYRLRPEHGKLISVRRLARISSALVFSKDSQSLLVADKTGDCYEYDCENLDAEPKLLFGHLSIVYDILWTPDKNYIITCDRDDKIRVTNYPNTYDIQCYCLGHKEFVSAMALLTSDTLLSISGDQSLRLWEFVEGKELEKIDLPGPGIKLSWCSLTPTKYQVAVLLYDSNASIAHYELTRETLKGKWCFSEPQLFNPSDEMICCNLTFVRDSLYVVGVVGKHLSIATMRNNIEMPTNWLHMIEEQFKSMEWQPEDITSRFKKKYDNVKEYLERKKRRLEQQKQK